MDLLDRMRCEVLAFRAPCTIGHRFGFQQQLIVSLNKLSGDVGQFGVPNLGYYIVSDERGVGLIGRKRPLRLAVAQSMSIQFFGFYFIQCAPARVCFFVRPSQFSGQ